MPAKKIYYKRGYRDTEFKIIPAKHNDFLCYDVCVKYEWLITECHEDMVSFVGNGLKVCP